MALVDLTPVTEELRKLRNDIGDLKQLLQKVLEALRDTNCGSRP